jgi:cytochrome c-type biogenesis protein CcmH
MLLWLIFAALTAGTLTAVLWPLLRGSADGAAKSAGDAAVYDDQLKEIEADLDRGLISAADAKAARTEVSRRLLAAADEAQANERAARAPASSSRVLALGCALLCLPVLSLILYLSFGSPGLPGRPLAARLQAPVDSQKITALVARVEARLREHPEDGQGWDVIAPVYLKHQRFQEAAQAYQHALRLLGEDTRRLEGYGEALALASNGIVTEQARGALEAALARDASLLKARFWLAVAKEQDGLYREAAAAWRDMLERGDENAPWRPMIEGRLQMADARAASGGAPQGQVQRPPQAQAASPEQPGPSAGDVEAAKRMAPAERAAMINQMVEGLAARLAHDGSDLNGWRRLVRAYVVLGKRQQAAKALSDARRNFAGDPEALAALNALAKDLDLQG